MPGNVYEEAAAMKKIIETIVKDVVKKETMSCLRVYKAQIVTPVPVGGSTYGVQLLGDTQTLDLPFSSKVGSGLSSGAIVWILVPFNDFKNAIVWEKLYFN
jgi:hypothetical protein